MLSNHDTNEYLTTIKFNLFDAELFKPNTDKVALNFELLTPVMAQIFCQSLGVMASKYSIVINRDAMRNAVGYDISVQVLTNQDLGLAKDNNEAKILTAINKALSNVDAKNQYNFTISKIAFSSIINNSPKEKFKSKIATKKYDFDAINGVHSIDILFLEEGDKLLSAKPHTTRYSRDSMGNATQVDYEYMVYTLPSSEHIAKLKVEVRTMVDENKNNAPILKSIEANEFNQALRRACLAEKSNLFFTLIKYDDKNELNLDFNQSSSNGKTCLDYAEESKNLIIISFLKKHGALNGASLHYQMIETYKNIIGKNSYSVINRSLNEPNPMHIQHREDPFEEANRINRENRQRIALETSQALSVNSHLATNDFLSQSTRNSKDPFEDVNQINIENATRRMYGTNAFNAFEQQNINSFEEINRLNRENSARGMFGSGNAFNSSSQHLQGPFEHINQLNRHNAEGSKQSNSSFFSHNLSGIDRQTSQPLNQSSNNINSPFNF